MIERPKFSDPPEIKIVGSGSVAQKDTLTQQIRDRFSHSRESLPEHGKKKIETLEYPKKDFEKAAIAEINHQLNVILAKFGVKPFDIPEENIYIVPASMVKGDGNEEGASSTIPDKQLILINAERHQHPRDRISTILHEMTHLKGFTTFEAAADGSRRIRRFGLVAYSTIKDLHSAETEEMGDFVHFRGLNEAVVKELERKLLKKILGTKACAKFKPDDTELKRIKLVAEKENLPEDEIRYADGSKEDPQEIIDFGTFGYRNERIVLNYIIDKILESHPEEFPDRDAVFDLFLRAHFQGDLKPLAKAIERTFGSDALRNIAMMDPNNKGTAAQVLHYLKKYQS